MRPLRRMFLLWLLLPLRLLWLLLPLWWLLLLVLLLLCRYRPLLRLSRLRRLLVFVPPHAAHGQGCSWKCGVMRGLRSRFKA